MRSSTSTRKHWLLNSNSTPFLEPVNDPLRVCLDVDRHMTKAFASYTSLIVNDGVVSVLRIHANGDGNLLAWPSSLFTSSISTFKRPHYVCVILVNVTFAIHRFVP